MSYPIAGFLALLSVLFGLVVLHLDAISLCLIAILFIVAVPTLRARRVRHWLRSTRREWLQGWRSLADAVWKQIRSRLHTLRERAGHLRAALRNPAINPLQAQHEVTQITTLLTSIKELGDDLDAFSRDWSEMRTHFYQRNQLALPDDAPSLPHQHLLSAYMALERALAHLLLPAPDGRVTIDDLTFYQDWVAGLHRHLAIFVDQYWEQQHNAHEALREVKQDHVTLGTLDHGMAQADENLHTEGVLAVLEYLLFDGGVHAASMMHLIEAYQSRMKERLARSTAYHF